MALSRQMSTGNSVLSYVESMLKSDSPQQTFTSYDHSSKLVQGLRENYQDCKFCDVILVVGGKEIKAHRVVLSAFSSYFKGLLDTCWKENEQEKIVVQDFDEHTLICIMNFAYSGVLEVNVSNALNLLAAADFLQLDFVKSSCGSYLKSLVSSDNCAAMLCIANKFHALNLESHLLQFAARHYYKVSQCEDFLELPLKVLAQLLQSESLVVDKGQDFLPSVAEQESFVFDSILSYALNQPNQHKAQVVEELLQYVRLCFLSDSTLQDFESSVNFSNCLGAHKLVCQAMATIRGDTDSDIPEIWRKMREAMVVRESCCRVHAKGYPTGPIQAAFDDRDVAHGSDTYINGMRIWIRRWDGRPVLGGFKIFYSNGVTSSHGGQDAESDVGEFRLEEGERIVKVNINSGWMIDNLQFHTNKGRVLGPYGGPGGSSYTENPKGSFGFLGYVKGAVVLSQEKYGIVNLRLVWKEFCLASNDDNDGNLSADQSYTEYYDTTDSDYDDEY